MPTDTEPVFDSPYGASDKERILASVVWKPDVDREKLFRQLELSAILCWYLRRAQPDRPPSKQLEFWKGVDSSLSDARQRLEIVLADSFLYLEIETAIANRPSGLVLENIPEAVRDTLAKACEGIVQAEALIEEPVSFASQEKTSRKRNDVKPGRKAAGRTADKPLYDFVKCITEQYVECAVDPRSPSVDSTEETDSELQRLLDACVRPLGVIYEARGIVSLWYRVKKTMPPNWPFNRTNG